MGSKAGEKGEAAFCAEVYRAEVGGPIRIRVQ
jgi:hypothetical protein